LGQLYLRTEDYKSARRLLEHVAKKSDNEQMRQQAEAMLTQLGAFEQQQERFKEIQLQATKSHPTSPELRAMESPRETVISPEPAITRDPSSYVREALRKPADGETQVQAVLQNIECVGKDVIFVVKIGEQISKLRTNAFNDIELTTYDPTVNGELRCGIRKAQESVVICFVPQVDKRTKSDGIIKSIEFVPSTFKLKP